MSIFDFYNILDTEDPSIGIKEHEEEIFEMIPELKKCKDFDNETDNKYKIYETTLRAVDMLPKDLTLRLSALFEYTGKPYTFTKESDGEELFYNYNVVSCGIFGRFATKFNVNNSIRGDITDLILYHNYNFNIKDEDDRKVLFNRFNQEKSDKLYKLKEANIKADVEVKLNKRNIYEKVK